VCTSVDLNGGNLLHAPIWFTFIRNPKQQPLNFPLNGNLNTFLLDSIHNSDRKHSFMTINLYNEYTHTYKGADRANMNIFQEP